MNRIKRKKMLRKALVQGGILCFFVLAGVGVFQLVYANTKEQDSVGIQEESDSDNRIETEEEKVEVSNNEQEVIEEEDKIDTALTQIRENLPVSADIAGNPILQLPELPTGCESVALTMALQSLGYSLDKTTIVDKYLVYEEENFAIGYIGDPASENGAGIFGPGLAKTANIFLESNGNQHRALDLTGTEFSDLYAYLASGYPVVMWTTMYFREPYFTEIYAEYEGKSYEWYSNEHCVFLAGYNLEEDTVKILDPLQGEVIVDIPTIQDIFEKTGKNAITIFPA